MLKSVRTVLTVAAATFALGGLATNALADTQWQKNHPRREQVNNRLKNQNQRIHKEVKEGELSKGQAAKLHTRIMRCAPKSAPWRAPTTVISPRPISARSISRKTRSASRSAADTAGGWGRRQLRPHRRLTFMPAARTA